MRNKHQKFNIKKTKLNIILISLYFLLAALSISYDVILIIKSPGTLFDNLTSFTHIWTILGLIFVFFGIYRIKKGHSFWKDCKKWLKITITSVVSLGLLICVSCLIFIFSPKLSTENENVPYMIFLGGGIDKNGKLPEKVMKRVEVAAEYLKNHEETICVVSGGKLKWLPVAEAPEIKNQLVLAGVNPDQILVEDKAQDTIQNFQYSCQVLADYEGVKKTEILKKPIIVLTSYFHLRRAEILAERMGFENIKGIGAPCARLSALHVYVREIAGYIKLNLRILFTGKPAPIID